MNDREFWSVVAIILALFLFCLLAAWGITSTYYKEKAADHGAAEYYIDEDNGYKRKFRWLEKDNLQTQ